MLNDLKKLNFIKHQQHQQQTLIHHHTTSTRTSTLKNSDKIVNNLFFEYYYNSNTSSTTTTNDIINGNLIKIPSPSSSLPSTPLSLQSSKSISTTTTASTTSSESLNENHHHQPIEHSHFHQHEQQQSMYANAYSNEEYFCLDDIDVLKPISINCNFYYQNRPKSAAAPGLLKITTAKASGNTALSVSTSSPSSCSFLSSSSASSIALTSPIKTNNNLNATPDTSNSSSATMIIRKSPEAAHPTTASSGSYSIRKHENLSVLSPPPSVNAKTNLNYIFSKFDFQTQATSEQQARRSMPVNYENDFMVLHDHQSNKRKINSLSPIMTSSRADLHSITPSASTMSRTPKQQLNFNTLPSSTATIKCHQTPKLKSILIPNHQQPKQQSSLTAAISSNTSTPVFQKKFVSFKLHNDDTFQQCENYGDDDDILNDLSFENAFSNDTYGICLQPETQEIYESNSKELNRFIEENRYRVERLRVKRLQVAASGHQQATVMQQTINQSPMVWMV